VCLPTESSYGLAVDPRNAQALANLRALKSRSENEAFALIAGDMQQAINCTQSWPFQARTLAEQHWPGALTLILPPGPTIGSACIGPTGGVGLRISSLSLARDVAMAFGHPVTATSANPSGHPPARLCSEAKTYFGDGVAVYLDGGRCAGPPSTLVDFDSSGTPQVLREGPIVLLP